MKIDLFSKARRTTAVRCLILLAFFAACAAQDAHAQWSASDAATAFTNYNTAFFYNISGDNYVYRRQQGSNAQTVGFWNGAETLEMAEDAYDLNPTSANQTIINQLCNGFVSRYTDNWSSNGFDDDLMWATISFVRAYQRTGNSQWLSDAETNFTTVWNRGYDTSKGGIWWDTPADNYKASASNWTFVIAGNLLYQATGNTTYQSEARTIYTWAMSNIYNSSTGQVYDGVHSTGPSIHDYSYNYGTAIGATYYEGDFANTNKMATYLMNNLSGGTYNGYNILPNYGQGGGDGGGFNGIALRWVGYAYAHGAISNTSVLSWAQTNVTRAWAQRNSERLSWNDWTTATPNGTNLWGWDCSDTVAGMQDIPVSTSTLIANGTYIVTNVNSGMALDDPGSSQTNGKDMEQYTVNNGTNQQWTVTNLGNNVITLKNVSSSQLLDVAAASKLNGALVDQYPSNNGNNQKWQVLSRGNGVYTVTSINSGLALDVVAASKSNSAQIDQYPYQGNTWQQWKFTAH